MAKLRVLFIGGSGVISSACSQVAVDSGIELFVLNRGRSTARPLPPGVSMLRADIREPATVRDEINDRDFDAVVDWVAFTPGHVHTDIDLFRGRTGQYVFISSASAYQTPPARMPVTESTPLRNRSGRTPVTRSPARTCSSPPTGSRGSRPQSCGPRTPTTRRRCRLKARGPCS